MSSRPDAADVNVSVFYLHNGMLSIIQSYIDLRFARDGAAQVHVPWLPQPDSLERHGPLALQRRQLLRFDEARLHEDLRARGRLNVFEVRLSHNSSGDGMSLATVAAARILDGQRKGASGEENMLGWETFPHTALSKTYNTDSQTPDSAGTMTAMISGAKTRMGFLSVSQVPERGQCAQSLESPLTSAMTSPSPR